MSQATAPSSPQQEPKSPLEPEPESALVYDCPIDGCSTRCETELGFRMHVSRSDDHDTTLSRAIMECAYCTSHFEVTRSDMDRAYCSSDCAYADGRSARPIVIEEPLSPIPVPVLRYPCPVDGCDFEAEGEKGFRRHATQQHDRGRVPITCKYCGDQFRVRASQSESARYCSVQCRALSKRDRKALSCEECGSEFTVIASRADESKYCSHDCHNKARKRPVTLVCKECGSGFEVVRYRADDAQFCSWNCYLDSASKESVEHTCDECGEEFTAPESRTDAHYCSRDCYHQSMRQRITRTCQECEDDFYVPLWRADTARYCSRQCADHGRRTRRRVWRTCACCSETFRTVEREDAALRFCGEDCQFEWFLSTHCQPTPDISNLNPEDLGLTPIGKAAPNKPLPDAIPPINWTVTFGECSHWRSLVDELGDLEAAANTLPLVPEPLLREHVTGRCTHGFQSQTPPVRYNGIDWVSMDFSTDIKHTAPRKAPTFDG